MNNTCTKQEFEEFMELIKTSTDFEDFDGPMKKQWESPGRKTSLIRLIGTVCTATLN
jgi:hypothetical protein